MVKTARRLVLINSTLHNIRVGCGYPRNKLFMFAHSSSKIDLLCIVTAWLRLSANLDFIVATGAKPVAQCGLSGLYTVYGLNIASNYGFLLLFVSIVSLVHTNDLRFQYFFPFSLNT